MKKIVLMIVLVISVFCSASAFAQEDVITVLVNNRKIESDVAPMLVNDRTMLPMRAIFEALGAKVTWKEKDQLIFATYREYMLTMQIDNNKMSVQKISSDKNIAIELDVAPFLHEGRTLVPVRAVAESLEATVEWIDETQTVVITKK